MEKLSRRSNVMELPDCTPFFCLVRPLILSKRHGLGFTLFCHIDDERKKRESVCECVRKSVRERREGETEVKQQFFGKNVSFFTTF